MPKRNLRGSAGVVFHVLNRGVRRLRLFDTPADYAAFVTCLEEAKKRVPVRVLAYCVMPNHFHMVVWPTHDGQLPEFMRLATVTHSKRWHQFRGSQGTGHVYQGRYKAFPVQTDEHFLTVCRYVERNAIRAGMVAADAQWAWGTMGGRCSYCDPALLDPWPVPPPPNWAALVRAPITASELSSVRRSVRRGTPFGDSRWRERTADRFSLRFTLASRGRPPTL